jgi:tetratricopeptide (TPR) repeat protein
MKKLAPAHARGAGSAARFATAASNFNAALARNDFRAGAQFAEEALRIVPGHMMVLSDYALCLMRIGAHEDAYKIYTNILAASPAKQRQASSTWFHGLVELCGLMGKHDELRRHGLHALNEADAMYRSSGIRLDAATQPPAFDPTRPEENIIAFSLFGANPRYCEPAVVNAQVTRELFKGWTCRVYLDDTVPQHVHRRLREAGAQLVEMDGSGPKPIHPLMWRFLVIGDPGVKRFLLRDADSLLSEREAAAVRAWIDSPFLFHHMRDYCSHTELILAGLWGGCGGVLPNMEQAMRDYSEQRNKSSGRFVDQHFLREQVWPAIRQSLLSHDELFGFHDALPFPPHAPVRWKTDAFHVGSNASHRAIGGASALPDGSPQHLLFCNSQGDVLFDYSAIVRGNEWRLDMPFFILDAIQAGRVQVRNAL